MKQREKSTQESSGLLLGSEPLKKVEHRATGRDAADDRKDSDLTDTGDDDGSDSDTSDTSDSDTTDSKDKGDGSGDSDGRD